SCNDSVEIIGIALGFRQSLLTARGASIPIGIPNGTPVERLNQRFRFHHHFVLGTLGVIDQLFWMIDSKASAATHVSGIGGTSRISSRESRCHSRVADNASPSTISFGLIIPIPTRRRKPNLDFDIGIAARF